MALAAFASCATAQTSPHAPAGSYFDGGGSEAQVSSRSFTFDRLTPSARPSADLVALFRDACLRADVGTEAARPAIVSRESWGFHFLDADAGVPSGGRLNGWQADDVSLTSQPGTWPLGECNVSAARLSNDDLTPIAAELSQFAGVQPDKRFTARAASGRKLVGETMRWTVKGPSGSDRHVYASSFTDLNGAFVLHLGLTEARPK